VGRFAGYALPSTIPGFLFGGKYDNLRNCHDCDNRRHRNQAFASAWAEAVTLISVHHLPDEVYAEAARVFSEQELVDLNLAVMSINSWNRLSIAFRYEPERE
jgi:alkylhydroperoxidase family enzyme